jgi:ABC-type dipeptide/oligopeptide/nickel transport system permease subunit
MQEAELIEQAELGGAVLSRERGLWGDAFYRLTRNRLAMAGLVLLIVVAVIAAAAANIHAVQRYDPYLDQLYDHIQEAPSGSHFFGTDNLGRDNWARVWAGDRDRHPDRRSDHRSNGGGDGRFGRQVHR